MRATPASQQGLDDKWQHAAPAYARQADGQRPESRRAPPPVASRLACRMCLAAMATPPPRRFLAAAASLGTAWRWRARGEDLASMDYGELRRRQHPLRLPVSGRFTLHA